LKPGGCCLISGIVFREAAYDRDRLKSGEILTKGKLAMKREHDYKIPAQRIILPNPFLKDPAWEAHLKKNAWWYHENLASPAIVMQEKEKEQFLRLHDILLQIGGYETCFPVVEEDMEKILSRGYYRKGTSKMMEGSPSRCHSNVCNLYVLNQRVADVTICTGYALSNDGLWRQHSWLLHRYKTRTQHRTRVIETTTKRVAYFGFEMTEKEAEVFCDNNF